jgi:creatinine amidohydrolase
MKATAVLKKTRNLWLFPAIFLFIAAFSPAQEGKPLFLQEMTWPDVREYLKSSDMVIIPLGSTEQHGPHLPLGTDYYLAMGALEKISAKTGVVVAPVLLVGYSEYHSGFPGTLSIKPDTMVQVLFESAQMLLKYGFRRLMFFNAHGGNNIVQQKIIHRINQETEAMAAAIGYGGSIQVEEEEFFDWHAGIEETSDMLYLKPALVRMERAEKPDIHFTPRMQELLALSKTNPELLELWTSLFAAPVETKKGGASHELSSNGVWCLSDPKQATQERGEKDVQGQVERAVKFIEAWKQAKE